MPKQRKPGSENTVAHLVALAETGRDEDVKAARRAAASGRCRRAHQPARTAETRNKVFRLLAPDVAPTVLSLLSPLAREKICPGPVARIACARFWRSWTRTTPPTCWGPSRRNGPRVILAGLPAPLSARIQQLSALPGRHGGRPDAIGIRGRVRRRDRRGGDRNRPHAWPRPSPTSTTCSSSIIASISSGVLPLARLILARAGETVDAVMDRQVISVTVNADQEEVAQLFRKYDLALAAGHRSPRRPARPHHHRRRGGRARRGGQRGLREARRPRAGRADLRFTAAHHPPPTALAGTEPGDDQRQCQRHRPLSRHDRDDGARRRVDDDRRRSGRQCRGPDADGHGPRPCPRPDHPRSRPRDSAEGARGGLRQRDGPGAGRRRFRLRCCTGRHSSRSCWGWRC